MISVDTLGVYDISNTEYHLSKMLKLNNVKIPSNYIHDEDVFLWYCVVLLVFEIFQNFQFQSWFSWLRVCYQMKATLPNVAFGKADIFSSKILGLQPVLAERYVFVCSANRRRCNHMCSTKDAKCEQGSAHPFEAHLNTFFSVFGCPWCYSYTFTTVSLLNIFVFLFFVTA